MTKNKFKINRKLGVSILVSFLIIALSILYILRINAPGQTYQHQANRGVFDLNDWVGDTNQFLEGQWEFYPDVLLSPEDDLNQYENIKKYVEVPGSWKSYLNEDGGVEGSGTYRLRIILSQDGDYGFKSRTIRTSNRIFANGNEIINVGNPSIERTTYVIDSKYRVGFSQSVDQEIDLIVNVTNFDNMTGGIISPIEFGSQEGIIKADRIDQFIDGTAIASALVLGLYFLLTSRQRGKDKDLSYFGLTSILIAIYLSTLNEQLLDLIIDYEWATRIQIQLIVLSLVAVCLTRFSNYFFKENVNRRVIKIITSMGLFNIALILSATGHITMDSVVVFQILSWSVLIICFINIAHIFIKNIINELHSLEYILIITSVLFFFSNAMVIKISFDMDLGRLLSILMFLLLLSTSMLISNKLQIDYRNVQSLSLKLIKDDNLKDEFLARASHELNTPLHVILNSSQSLIEGKKGSLNSDQQESLLFINQEGKRLSRLVEDLLNASQIKRGETNLRFSPIHIYRTVESILREMDILIPEEKDIVLINDVEETLPVINSDSDKFTQILYNLVNNSIKYTKSGEIRVSASLENEYIAFEVMDTGIGISEEDKDEIFKVFYKKIDTENSGMGIGLPITKHLVEALGGEISVESSYGQGSIFRFTIPINESEKVSEEIINPVELTEHYEPRLKPSTDYFIDKPTILISDDRISNQKILLDILEGSGYNLLLAKNGAETLETLDKYNVDLIVLDFMLPDMSGAEISKEIRKKHSMVELPIIMLTASGKSIDLENSFEYGANDFIKKPADAQELISRINSLLQMKDSVREGLKREFQYFYSQISPHFLYNTMNTIIGLSYKDMEATRTALNNLSIYFRGKLDLYKDKILIPLEEEMELVRAYLEIEELRYGPRLNVEIDIEEDLNIHIPPMTIQPLVENSIRHGISAKKDGGYVRIRAKRYEDSVIITVEDNGVGMSQEKQEDLMNGKNHRLGFTNIIEKLKIMKDASLELESKESKGTKIKITILCHPALSSRAGGEGS